MIAAHQYQTVQKDGVVTHVILPVDEFLKLTEPPASSATVAAPSDSEIDAAIGVLNDPDQTWRDAESVLWQVLRDGLAPARKSRGLTQEQLASELGMSQPQVSRMESNLDSATLRVLRRVAERLAQRSPAGGC
jgi:hypothetical protein